MAATNYYVDPVSGVDTMPGGTIGAPWATIQYALNNIVRDAVNGDQINLKSGGTHQTPVAGLGLTTYGTPAAAAPLILRGYTAAAGDGGRASVINTPNSSFWNGTASYLWHIDLDIVLAATDSNYGLQLGNAVVVLRYSVTGLSRYMVNGGTGSVVAGCYVSGSAAGAYDTIIALSSGGRIIGNYVKSAYNTTMAISGYGAIIAYNVVHKLNAAGHGISARSASAIINNTVYNASAGTGNGIQIATDNLEIPIIGNVVEGFSGVGGCGITNLTTSVLALVANNAVFNCTTPYGVNLSHGIYEGNLTLASSPFVNPAGDDFRVSDALKALGWPASFLGASSPNYLDIGAVQRVEPAGGGGGAVRIMPLAGRMGG